MKYRNLINEQSQDITVLSQLLKTYVDSYRLLIGGASELYNVNLAKKSEVKKALDKVKGRKLISKLLSKQKEEMILYLLENKCNL